MITRWDPFAELNRLHDQAFLRGTEAGGRARPAVDIREEADAYVIAVDVPGVAKDDVKDLSGFSFDKADANHDGRLTEAQIRTGWTTYSKAEPK